MRAHAAVARALTDLGVDMLFGVIGDANLEYIAEYVDRCAGHFVSAAIESAAVGMADGYSRASLRPGVASVTHGPALTNTLTALTEAARAKTPLLVLTGDTAAAQRNHPQEIDIRAVAHTAGAYYDRARKGTDVAHAVRTAIRRCLASRRPVVLDLPTDVLDQQSEYQRQTLRLPIRPPLPDEAALDEALGIVASARRPVLLAGRGARWAGAAHDIAALAEHLGAPLATTLLGKDLFRGNRFDLGIMGTLATDVALDVLSQSDCIVSFGASMNRFTTVDGGLLRGKAAIRCDDDPESAIDDEQANVVLIGDARATARAMYEALTAVTKPQHGQRTPELADRLAAFSPRAEFDDASTDRTLDMREAMVVLDEFLPPSRQVVTDAGRFTRAAWRYLHSGPDGGFTHTGNFGSIGLGIPTALGAALAQPSKLTVAVAGDGGTMMSLTALHTAAVNQANLLIVVLNDSCYGMEHNLLTTRGLDPKHSLLQWPEFCELATTFGVKGFIARTGQELAACATEALAGPLPALIEVKSDARVDILQ